MFTPIHPKDTIFEEQASLLGSIRSVSPWFSIGFQFYGEARRRRRDTDAAGDHGHDGHGGVGAAGLLQPIEEGALRSARSSPPHHGEAGEDLRRRPPHTISRGLSIHFRDLCRRDDLGVVAAANVGHSSARRGVRPACDEVEFARRFDLVVRRRRRRIRRARSAPPLASAERLRPASVVGGLLRHRTSFVPEHSRGDLRHRPVAPPRGELARRAVERRVQRHRLYQAGAARRGTSPQRLPEGLAQFLPRPLRVRTSGSTEVRELRLRSLRRRVPPSVRDAPGARRRSFAGRQPEPARPVVLGSDAGAVFPIRRAPVRARAGGEQRDGTLEDAQATAHRADARAERHARRHDALRRERGGGGGGRGASKAGHPVRGERQRARPTVVRGACALDVARGPAGEGPPPSAAGGLVRADRQQDEPSPDRRGEERGDGRGGGGRVRSGGVRRVVRAQLQLVQCRGHRIGSGEAKEGVFLVGPGVHGVSMSEFCYSWACAMLQ
ncbi:hypothetical protein ACHAWF_002090 [Thalassiosira exigua]